MTEAKKIVKLEGTERKNEDGKSRLELAKSMLEAGSRVVFLETDELPFAPKAIAAISEEGEVLGYLPNEIAKEIYDDVLTAEDDEEEDVVATLVSAGDDAVEIEIDFDELPVYDERPQAEEKAPPKKNRNPANYALIAIIAFYLAYRLFTKSGG